MNLYGYDWPQGGTKQVVYVDGQSHIIEFCRGLEGRWQSTDLTGVLATLRSVPKRAKMITLPFLMIALPAPDKLSQCTKKYHQWLLIDDKPHAASH
jgi:hypothetical protein